MSPATALQVADRTPEVTAFHEHAFWLGAHSSERDAWLQGRRTMLTASDVGAVMGEDPYKGPLDVYADKVAPPVDEELGLDDPRLWGLVLEQPILQTVASYRGWEYRRCGALLQSRRHPFLGATLDAEINRGAGWQPFEGKTTELLQDWDQDANEMPTRVLLQAQTQLLVTGADQEIVFALLRRSRPCQVEVHASPELQEVIVATAEAFMHRVSQLDPPPPIEGLSAKAALKRLYPQDHGGQMKLPPEAVEWTREYIALGKEIKKLETRREYLNDLIRASIGPYTWGVLPESVDGNGIWRCQLEKRAAYTVEASEHRKLLAMKERK